MNKKWLEWCMNCAHGFYVEIPDATRRKVRKVKRTIVDKVLRKPAKTEEYIEPKPSKCPVCGKSTNVDVIKLVNADGSEVKQ